MRKCFPILIAGWTVITLVVLVSCTYILHRNSETLVEPGSKAFLKILAATRQWNTNHGSVSVPVAATMYTGSYLVAGKLAAHNGFNAQGGSVLHLDYLTYINAPDNILIITYSAILLSGILLLLYLRSVFKRHSLELETKNKELQDLNAAKDKFFSVIAHDLKTPAANIESLSQTLKDRFTDFSEDEQRNCIDMLVESAKTHNELLNTMLDLSRLRLGSKQYSPERLNIQKLVNGVLEQTKLQAQQKQITQINLVDECFAMADKNMITTVTRNIVVNAVKFTYPGGKITVCTESTGSEITISIADTGTGIDDSIRNRIFEVDYNKSTVGTANESGTGLGLVLCKEYVERNGGRIWFESEAGKGTTFFFTLPASV